MTQERMSQYTATKLGRAHEKSNGKANPTIGQNMKKRCKYIHSMCYIIMPV